jgi:copper(I)-binding protein
MAHRQLALLLALLLAVGCRPESGGEAPAAAAEPAPAVPVAEPSARQTETGAVATVLDEDIHSTDPAEVQDAILSRLFDRYVEQQGITVTDAELDAYVESMRAGMAAAGLTAESELTPEEAAEVDAMRRDMGRALIRQWKINRALYKKYGGRIVYQQLGPEPLDAYRRFLEGAQAAGVFTIHDASVAEAFWRYFTDESMHDFMEPDGEDEARAFTMPPWERSE